MLRHFQLVEVPQCCLIHSVRRFEAKKCPSPASPATAGVVLSVSGMSFNYLQFNIYKSYNWIQLGGTPAHPSTNCSWDARALLSEISKARGRKRTTRLHLHIHRHGSRFHHTRHQPELVFRSWLHHSLHSK